LGGFTLEQFLDRISDAYYGELGPDLARNTRKRVQWMIKNVQGNRILDIGCSQGLVSILLAREGKTVKGIDIAKESIDFANKSLSQEQSQTKALVEFINGNFLYEELPENYFDTIIISEVLEHFFTSKDLLTKANILLNEEGRIIVTVPFGINDFPDHKRTLYLMEIYQEMTPYFEVEQVEFMGKWIGFIGRKAQKISSKATEELFLKTEKAFYLVEQELIDKNKRLKLQNQNYKSQIEDLKTEGKRFYSKESEQRETILELSKSLEILEKQLHEAQIQSENIRLDAQEKERQQKEIIERSIKQLQEAQSVIKGLQLDNSRMQDNMTITIHNFNSEKRIREEEIAELKSKIKDLLSQIENSKLHISELGILHGEKDVQIAKLLDKQSENDLKLRESREQLELREIQISDLINQLTYVKSEYEIQIKLIKETNLKELESFQELNQQLESSALRADEQAQNDRHMIECLKQDYQAILNEMNKLKASNEEIETMHLAEIQKLEEQLNIQIVTGNQNKDALLKKLNDLEVHLAREKTNHLKEKGDFTFLLKKESELNEKLNQQLFALESKFNVAQRQHKLAILKLKEELSAILDESELLTINFMKEIKSKEIIQRKYQSLKNSKLGKVTLKYWELRNRS
jgi:ubiquinone/menaquinone biosynthesis C-methylase UbiE